MQRSAPSTRKRLVSIAALATLYGAFALPAAPAPAAFPEKPVRIVVPFAPGGGTDLVAKSPPDGYNIVIASFAHAVNPSLQPKLPFSTDKDFAPIVLIGRGPNVLVVRADGPYKNVRDITMFAPKRRAGARWSRKTRSSSNDDVAARGA